MSDSKKPLLIAIAGPKGGVGKSFLALNLAAALAESRPEVVLVDLDLGGANLHVLAGLSGLKRGLSDFINDNMELADLLYQTPVKGLRLLPGSSDSLGLANLLQWQKVKLIKHLGELPARIVIADLGAGSTYNTLDFYDAAHIGLMVLTPELTSALNAYSFIKSLLLRKLLTVLKPKKFGAAREIMERAVAGTEGLGQGGLPELIEEISSLDAEAAGLMREATGKVQPMLILNMVDHSRQAKVAEALDRLSRRRLGLELNLLGQLPYDPQVRLSIHRMKPLYPHQPDSMAGSALSALAARLGSIIDKN